MHRSVASGESQGAEDAVTAEFIFGRDREQQVAFSNLLQPRKVLTLSHHISDIEDSGQLPNSYKTVFLQFFS